MEKKCKNCEHWGSNHSTRVTSYADNSAKVFEAAPCRVSAIELDTYGAVVYTSGESDCLQYEDAFEPHADYLEFMQENSTPLDVLYGITVGVDCPATLHK